jgi:transcriptional regulator with XRE-family HTH domain
MELNPVIFFGHHPRMNKTKRTEFGVRVLRARKAAKLTQHQLAAAVGCTQGNIVEAEHRASGSALTVAIATVCRVDARWLADGVGEMFVGPDSPPVPDAMSSVTPSDIVRALARLLEPLSPIKRRTIGLLLQNLADDPAAADGVAPDIAHLITPQH